MRPRMFANSEDAMGEATTVARTDIGNMLLEAAGLTLDKLPMLHVVFDRMATSCADGMWQLAASQSYFSFSHCESGRIGEILEEYEAQAIAAVFQAVEWDSHVIIGFDRDFVFTIVEVLLGSDGSEPPVDEERPFSNIEMKLSQSLLEMAAKSLAEALSIVTPVTFRYERIETRMDFAVIGRHNNQAVAAKFLLQAINRGGEMFIIIPQSALTPVRQQLSHVPTGDAAARDPKWMKQLQSEVRRATVEVRAVLEERPLALNEIAGFEVGQVIELQATPRTRLKLEANEQPLFWCRLGQAEGRYTLRVEDSIEKEGEIADDGGAR